MATYAVQPEWIQGAISIETLPEGLKPWRLPHHRKALFATPNEILLDKAEKTAGVRLRFWSDSPTVALAVAPLDEARCFDLVLKNEILDTLTLETNQTTLNLVLPKAGVYELWLPIRQLVVLQSLTTEDGTEIKHALDERKRWLTWGSSITQCGESHSPARSWPATAARQHDLHLTCMGFGGNCHMEGIVAKVIRDTPADLITLKLGINVYGQGSLANRTFEIAALGIVDLIREKHPHTPIGLISPIYGVHRETEDNAVNMTLQKMRDYLADAHQRLVGMGDSRITYTSGLDVFGEDAKAMLPDNLHPNGDGYEYLGRNVADKVLPDLLKMLG